MRYHSSELSINISNFDITYNELMKLYKTLYFTQIASFLERLKHFPGLMTQNGLKIDKKLHVSIITKFAKEIKECWYPQTLIDMIQKVKKGIRSKLIDSFWLCRFY